jgi:NDP-sugar pyrophosphorylase family protein
MDNILFIPATRETAWVGDMLPGTSPAELPVAGKRIIDYAIEHAQRFGVMFTEVLDWHFSERLADDFADMTRTGFPVFYMKGEGELPKGLNDIDGYSSPLTGNITDGLVVVWGLVLSMHMAEDVSLEPITEQECAETPAGVYRREGGRWMRVVPHGLVVRNVKAWHELNLVVLRHPEEFTVPGYSSERGVHIGRNVVLEHGTEVKPPVLLQDNTWLARNVRLEGDVIVDSGSYISEGSRLRKTVVCSNTFIGEGLDLESKIVVGRRVIDAETGTWIDLEEPGLARQIPVGLGWLRSLWHFLRGRSYGRRG